MRKATLFVFALIFLLVASITAYSQREDPTVYEGITCDNPTGRACFELENTENVIIRNSEITVPAGLDIEYVIYLNNVSNLEINNITIDGNSEAWAEFDYPNKLRKIVLGYKAGVHIGPKNALLSDGQMVFSSFSLRLAFEAKEPLEVNK